jgi:hypothetical protein
VGRECVITLFFHLFCFSSTLFDQINSGVDAYPRAVAASFGAWLDAKRADAATVVSMFENGTFASEAVDSAETLLEFACTATGVGRWCDYLVAFICVLFCVTP